jgi:hypothetical protein
MLFSDDNYIPCEDMPDGSAHANCSLSPIVPIVRVGFERFDVLGVSENVGVRGSCDAFLEFHAELQARFARYGATAPY